MYSILDDMVKVGRKPYLMGKTPVTERQWAEVMGEKVPSVAMANLPKGGIGIVDAWRFLEKVNAAPEIVEKKLVFRLPTSEEWKHACLSGKKPGKSVYDMGWFKQNSEGKLHPVATKEPNAFGLYDMAGNVSELCSDGTRRGGDYCTDPGRSGAGINGSALWSQGSLSGHHDEGLRLLAEENGDRSWWRNLNKDCWAALLPEEPSAMGKCNCIAEFEGSDWVEILKNSPKLAEFCAWSKLDGYNWCELLSEQPQLSKKCDWSLLNEDYWSRLLCVRPQFATKCDKWDEMSACSWRNIIIDQPQFAARCDKWDEFDELDWSQLLAERPEFADKCDWSKITSDYCWEQLIEQQPQFAKRRK